MAKALKHLKARTASWPARLRTLVAAITQARPADRYSSFLRRLGLDRPEQFRDRLLRRLVVLALKETGN